MSKCIVYGLYSSEDGIVRYIGQTIQSLETRLRMHLYGVKKSNIHRHNWMRSVIDSGHTVEIKVLCEDAVWNETEKELIQQHRESGVKLVNCTAGGDGVRDLSEESRKKISDFMKSKIYSDTTRENFRKAHLGKPLSETHRKNMIESVRQTYSGERGAEIKAKMSEKRKGVPKSEAHKEAIRQGHLRRIARLAAGL